jgi:beta-glucanase (GH16 family)
MQSGRKRFLLLYTLITGLAITCGSQTTTTPTKSNGWTLVWSDEFDGPNGSPVDRSRWAFDIGGQGRGNRELEYYTDRSENASVHNGNLVIKTLREKYTGPDGVTRNYTSARLKTFGKFSQPYGRFEARIKIPYG